MILRVECLRAIDRMRVRSGWTPVQVAAAVQDLRDRLDAIDEISLSDDVLELATRPFPVVVETLDAIHLASALLWKKRNGEPIHFLTNDRRLGLAARAVGLEASGFAERG